MPSELLPLPMTPRQCLDGVIAPTFGKGGVLPASLRSKESDVLVLAIMLQESGLKARRQYNNGPARGLAQFERGGGVHGVLNHPASMKLAAKVCEARGVEPTAGAVHFALEFDDILACAFARLLLLTDPRPLPALGELDETWDYYIRNWRPGKPHRRTWERNYLEAMEATIEEEPAGHWGFKA